MTDFLRGATTALLTPCDDDGAVDHAALALLVERQVEAGVVGLFALGTAGQGPMLTSDERMAILERIIAAADGRVTVIAHVGALPTSTALDLARHARAAGADGISAVPPTYYATDRDATRRYYDDIAAAGEGLPLIAYNNPSATGYDLSPAEAVAMFADGVISGVKQASPRLTDVHALVEGGVPVWMANADLNLAALAIGAVGTISTITNAAPEPIVRLFRAVADGDLLRARSLQRDVDYCAARLRTPTIGALHAGAAMRGWPAGSPRRPLRMPDPGEMIRIRDAVARATAL